MKLTSLTSFFVRFAAIEQKFVDSPVFFGQVFGHQNVIVGFVVQNALLLQAHVNVLRFVGGSQFLFD